MFPPNLSHLNLPPLRLDEFIPPSRLPFGAPTKTHQRRVAGIRRSCGRVGSCKPVSRLLQKWGGVEFGKPMVVFVTSTPFSPSTVFFIYSQFRSPELYHLYQVHIFALDGITKDSIAKSLEVVAIIAEPKETKRARNVSVDYLITFTS